MSFLSSPDRYGFAPTADECASCFPTDETPDTLILTLEGIKIGDDWLASDESPPNGTWELPGVGSCSWLLVDPPYTFSFASLLFISELQVIGDVGGTIFTRFSPPNCLFNFINSIDSPIGANYFDGRGLLTAPIGESDISNLEQMDLLNLDPKDDFWVKPNYSLNDKFSNGYFLAKDRTNILIQYDLT